MHKALPTLFIAIFTVMIGFGVTLPVLSFFTERLALAEGASRDSVAIHVGMLTAVYALMQLLLALVWGLWSDRIGRRRLVLTGIAESMAAQILFGMSVSLWLLFFQGPLQRDIISFKQFWRCVRPPVVFESLGTTS